MVLGKYVLAIDQGTTGTTVILFDRQSEMVGKVYQEFTQYHPAGLVEHDALEIWVELWSSGGIFQETGVNLLM